MNKNIRNIVGVLLGLIIINFLASKVYHRFDLTKDKRYTLSGPAITSGLSVLLGVIQSGVLITLLSAERRIVWPPILFLGTTCLVRANTSS